jgi:serine/threonine protein kinase
MEKYDFTLEAVVRRPGPVPRNAVFSLLQHTLRGVAYLHAKGIVHRDLKIENVMVRRTPEGEEAVIIDLGLAEEFAKERFFSEKCGTPGYIAPEIYGEVRPASPEKCDIFSLGVILHIL